MIEATGKVASEVVQSLKGNPLALALIVINVMFLAMTVFVLYSVSSSNERRDAFISTLVANCQPPIKQKQP